MFGDRREIFKAANAIASLDSVELQQAVIMRYLGGYSDLEIAQEMNVSPDKAAKLAITGLRQAKDIFKQ